jgi:chromatin structure-remodeling complex subunit RSC1/2
MANNKVSAQLPNLTSSGDQWINVCWYYRPEQTVHRSSRTFYENEVFKSGQYRDHPAVQILSKTFVQFITRYTRGRPQMWPENEKIWVCESRYNDLTKAFSKINQWRACVPEEIRFDEYELILFERQRVYEKYPSPLLPLLKGDEKVIAEGEKVPDPLEQGSEDAPPTVGAIYRGDSPEPEKEPNPPPPPPQPVQPRALPNLEPVSLIAPGLPQPMPYKNPVNATPQAPSTTPFRPLPPQRYQSAQRQQLPQAQNAPAEQPLAFTMPVAVPPEVAELVHKDNQGRVLWFGVPPVDIVGWGGGEGVRGHTLEYLAKKRKREGNAEPMQDVTVAETTDDKIFKKKATEILVKALAKIGR